MTTSDSNHTPVWFDISTPDAVRIRSFYREMFGWQVNALDDTYALVGDERRPSGGIGRAGPDSPYIGIVVYFPVDDVEAALARAESLGGTRVMEPTETPMRVIAAIADPDGNTVGLQGR